MVDVTRPLAQQEVSGQAVESLQWAVGSGQLAVGNHLRNHASFVDTQDGT